LLSLKAPFPAAAAKFALPLHCDFSQFLAAGDIAKAFAEAGHDNL